MGIDKYYQSEVPTKEKVSIYPSIMRYKIKQVMGLISKS